ncbi:MAG TPA: extracellular solute-binding protein [Verrucomicrobiae bacterium]|nr:extracellular solute-binding protein [Verrucomicrobiae bacterium]
MQRFFKRVLAVMAILSLAGQGCTKTLSPETQAASKPVTITIWSVVDDSDVYADAMNAFRAQHPNVTFDFRRLRLEEYESQLVNALAEDRGPDIFLIHNDWTGEYMPKITPMPKQTKTAYRTVTQDLQHTPTWVLQTEPTISLKEFKDQYADVVSNDVLRTVNIGTSDKQDIEQRPMGVPVSVDTLALYYNKDFLNAAGIPTPPSNWTEFSDDVKKLTKLDSTGKLVQSAAGIGTAFNVERATDILTALMVQNGAEMGDQNGVLFNRIPAALQGVKDNPPSYEATDFYTSFADPTKDTYTWNASQPNSLDAFVQGKVAFFFGYSYQYADIKARAPKLNLGISKLPQIEGNPVKNVANYWYWVVSKKSDKQDIAWRFLDSLTDPDTANKVLSKSFAPAALKSQLANQLQDERVGVFASQVLTATSWYEGSDPKTTETALENLINDVNTGARDTQHAVSFAAGQIGQTY